MSTDDEAAEEAAGLINQLAQELITIKVDALEDWRRAQLKPCQNPIREDGSCCLCEGCWAHHPYEVLAGRQPVGWKPPGWDERPIAKMQRAITSWTARVKT